MFVKYDAPEESSQDFRNREIIDRMVSDHFSLYDESYKYFNKELFTPTVDGELHRLFCGNPSLRVSSAVESFERFEGSDEGWQIFKNEFWDFTFFHNISYNIFREGKVLIGKNKVKFRKALIAHYTDQNRIANTNRDIFKRSTYDPFVTDAEKESDKIINGIDGILKRVNDNSLTKKKNLRVVVSANFADFFLCSTGESWSSCLSLRTDYEYAYWTGLPGLIGDKNRVIVYVTDGGKKDFHGIEVDSMMCRTWGVLCDDGKIHLLNWYPNKMVRKDELNEMFGQELFSEQGSFTSKHKIHPIWNDDGNSRFIYQDYTAFTSDGYIVDSGSGHAYFDNFELGHMEFGDLYDIPETFENLMNRGDNVGRYEYNSYGVCNDCGERIEYEDDVRYGPNSEGPYCQSCYEEIYHSCECGRDAPYDDCVEDTETGELYCPVCSSYDLIESEHNQEMYRKDRCYEFIDSDESAGYIFCGEVDDNPEYTTLDNGVVVYTEDVIEREDGILVFGPREVRNGNAIYCKFSDRIVFKEDATYVPESGGWVANDELEAYRDSLQLKLKLGIVG